MLVSACGPLAPTVASSTPSQQTATATASAPDVQRVDVTATGVGAYMLVTVPVAVVHNAAAHHDATGVVVHFTTKRNGAALAPLDSAAVTLHPDETLLVTANCTDTCNDANGVGVAVSVGAWSVVSGQPIRTTPGVYHCGAGCRGHGYGSVDSNLAGPSVVAGASVLVFAGCRDGSGALIGGGSIRLDWPANPAGAVAVNVPVILSAPPTACQLSASVGT